MSVIRHPSAKARPEESLADEPIVRRILAGEGGLFELLMRRYNQRLFRVARGILGDDAEAEDVVQEAYVNAYRHLDQFSGRARFATWLTKIAVHEASARARRRRRFTALESLRTEDHPSRQRGEEPMSPAPSPESSTSTEEMRRILEKLIDALQPAQRSVFVLREMEGLTTQETADCLGISPEAVKVRLHRSKRSLRRDLISTVGLAASGAYPFLGPRCDRMVVRVLTRLQLPLPESLPGSGDKNPD